MWWHDQSMRVDESSRERNQGLGHQKVNERLPRREFHAFVKVLVPLLGSEGSNPGSSSQQATKDRLTQ